MNTELSMETFLFGGYYTNEQRDRAFMESFHCLTEVEFFKDTYESYSHFEATVESLLNEFCFDIENQIVDLKINVKNKIEFPISSEKELRKLYIKYKKIIIEDINFNKNRIGELKLSDIKEEAYLEKTVNNITQSEALESISQKYGYLSYHQAQKVLGKLS